MTWTNKERLAAQVSYQIALTILENLAIYQNYSEEYHTRNLRKLDLISMTTILQNNLGNL